MDEREAEHTGYSNGVEDGIQQGYRKIAKKMKNKGKNINEIIEITGLSEEEINKL